MKFLYLSGIIFGTVLTINLILSLFELHLFNFSDHTNDDNTFLGYLRTIAFVGVLFWATMKCLNEYEKENKKEDKKNKK